MGKKVQYDNANVWNGALDIRRGFRAHHCHGVEKPHDYPQDSWNRHIYTADWVLSTLILIQCGRAHSVILQTYTVEWKQNAIEDTTFLSNLTLRDSCLVWNTQDKEGIFRVTAALCGEPYYDVACLTPCSYTNNANVCSMASFPCTSSYPREYFHHSGTVKVKVLFHLIIQEATGRRDSLCCQHSITT